MILTSSSPPPVVNISAKVFAFLLVSFVRQDTTLTFSMNEGRKSLKSYRQNLECILVEDETVKKFLFYKPTHYAQNFKDFYIEELNLII